MIERLRVENFKILREFEQDFGPINVFIGPNASGKSTALQAIETYKGFLSSSVKEYFEKEKGWAPRKLPNLRYSKSEMIWKANFRFAIEGNKQVESRYKYEMSLGFLKHLRIKREELSCYFDKHDTWFHLMARKGRRIVLLNEKSDAPKAIERYERTTALRLVSSVMTQIDEEDPRFALISRFRKYLFTMQNFLLWDPKMLRKTSRGFEPQLGPSGEDMPSFIAYLQSKEPEKHAKLLKRVQRIFPSIENIRSVGSKYGWRHLEITEGFGDVEKPVKYPSEFASDGLLRMLAIFSFRFNPNPPRIITLEEPENGVHPRLLSDIIDELKYLAFRKKPYPTQIFFSTHSPYVLDEFRGTPEAVYVFERKSRESSTKVTRLSNRSDLVRAIERYGDSLGEFWFSGQFGTNT